MKLRTQLWAAASILSTIAALDTISGLTDDQVDSVQQRLQESATESWEIGVQLEAIIHLRYPEFAPSHSGSLPDLSTTDVSKISDAYTIIENVVSAIPSGQQQIMPDRAAGDPNSILPAILLASLMKGSDSARLSAVANNQLAATMSTRRSSSGAISQRTDYVQLWSDFMYMVPPAIGYYGYLNQNLTMLQMAFNQTELYWQALGNNSLWMHVVDGPWQDRSLWATGNAWAVNGQMRLIEMAVKSNFAANLTQEIDKTVDRLNTNLAAGWAQRNPLTGMLPNSLEDPTSFSDAASTALFAATSYRFASGGYGSQHISDAETARASLQRQISPDGWLQNVVDPIEWDELGTKSPEAQAFVMLMQAAWRDWSSAVNAKVVSSNKRRWLPRFQRDI